MGGLEGMNSKIGLSSGLDGSELDIGWNSEALGSRLVPDLSAISVAGDGFVGVFIFCGTNSAASKLNDKGLVNAFN
jgi:hypothetical protein